MTRDLSESGLLPYGPRLLQREAVANRLLSSVSLICVPPLVREKTRLSESEGPWSANSGVSRRYPRAQP
jgi:hypothetical protein